MPPIKLHGLAFEVSSAALLEPWSLIFTACCWHLIHHLLLCYAENIESASRHVVPALTK